MNDKSEAYKNGWLAQKNKIKSHQNPYNGAQPYSYNQWNEGWCERYSTIKDEGNLSLDKELI